MTTHRPARVIHLAGNDVLPDARVLKYLGTTAALGLETIAVGVRRSGSPVDRNLDQARLIVPVVPAPWRTALAARLEQVTVVLRPGYRTADERESARAQIRRWSAKISGLPGLKGTLARIALAGLTLSERILGAIPRSAPLPQRTKHAPDRAPANRTAWRRVHPVALRDERTIGPLLDQLEPDVLHVHDVYLLGAAVQAARRARQNRRELTVIYDAHEFVPGVAGPNARSIAGWADLEREYIGDVDRIVTVSDSLADVLVDHHGLARRPAVVLNAPLRGTPPDDFQTVRSLIAIPADARLLVYGGGVNPARGVETAVDALVMLPDVHLVVVRQHHNYVVEALVGRAKQLGVSARFHLAPYAPADLVTAYLADADIGLSTLLHSPNHDVAVTNKFCEYVVAGLPVVTSDTPAQAELVNELSIGAVYPAGDSEALARSIQTVLTDYVRFADRLKSPDVVNRFTWEAQTAVIREVYRELGLIGTGPDHTDR